MGLMVPPLVWLPAKPNQVLSYLWLLDWLPYQTLPASVLVVAVCGVLRLLLTTSLTGAEGVADYLDWCRHTLV